MVTVRNILQRPSFRYAHLAAGSGGVERTVSWVHVGEVAVLGDFLKGGELILTTGVGLSTEQLRTRFLDGIIQAHAAGLVLELGKYFPEVPRDLRDSADRQDFPILVFSDPVRFLELSQDINRLIVNEHLRIMDDLEALSAQLRQALLQTSGAGALLRALHDSIRHPVAFYLRDSTEPPIIIGPWADFPGPFEDAAVHPVIVPGKPTILRQTVQVFGLAIGDLVMALPERTIGEHSYLAIDRTAAALAQDYIRVEGLDRKRRREDAALLEHLLLEEQPALPYVQRFRSRYQSQGDCRYQVIVANQAPPSLGGRLVHYLSDNLAVIRLAQSDREILVCTGTARHITPLVLKAQSWLSPQWTAAIGFSAIHSDPAEMHEAYLEASDAAIISEHRGSPLAYDALGICRWILATPQKDLERLVINPEIGVLLTPTEPGWLLQTLEELLVHADSKLAASAALGIHRQTLYSRIQHLSRLLGDDFMRPERRLSLHAAIVAYRYLHPQLRTGQPAHSPDV